LNQNSKILFFWKNLFDRSFDIRRYHFHRHVSACIYNDKTKKILLLFNLESQRIQISFKFLVFQDDADIFISVLFGFWFWIGFKSRTNFESDFGFNFKLRILRNSDNSEFINVLGIISNKNVFYIFLICSFYNLCSTSTKITLQMKKPDLYNIEIFNT